MKKLTVKVSLALGTASILCGAAMAQNGGAAAGAGNTARSDADDIIVTAQFRATNVQDTPLAITAVGGKALEARGIVDVQQLAATAPSVTLAPAPAAFGRTVISYIRGVGANDFNPAFDPSVGFYIDDIYHASLGGTAFDLMDLERVEILRGPQGTLFGKNTIGGAIRLISKKPDGQWGGNGALTYGSFDRIEARGSLNIPLAGDDLALRLSGVHKQRKGYVKRYDFACLNPSLAGSLTPAPNVGSDCRAGREGGENVDAVRAALRAKPTSMMEINLSGDYTDDRSEPGAMVLKATGPDAVLNGPGNPAAGQFPVNTYQFLPRFGIPYDNRFIAPGNYRTYSSFTNPLTGERFKPQSRSREYGFAGTIDLELNDNLKLKTITGYRNLRMVFSYDSDGSPLALINQLNTVKSDQFSQEVQLLGKSFDDKLDWVVGGYYFKGNSSYNALTDLVVLGFRTPAANQFKVEDKSAFTHLTLHLTDRLNLTGGLRYTRETKKFAIQQSYQCYIPNGSGITVTCPPVLPPIDFTANPLKYERWDPKLSIDYAITPDVMVYGQFSTGFRGGGFNNRPFTPAQVFPVGPEKLKAYELGVRTQFLDRALTVNLTGFQSDYSQMQVVLAGTDAAGTPFSAPLNVGDSRIRGIELESALRLGGFDLSLTGNYIDAKITQSRSPANLNLAPGSLPPRGAHLPFAPKWRFSAGVQYAADLGTMGTLTPRLDWTYQSQIDYDLNTSSPLSKEPGYSVVDARLTWANQKGLSITAGVTNLFDKYYNAYIFDTFAQGLGSLEVQPSRPREWSLTVRKAF